uniref:Putative helicase n=1 Tax=viral metagenome TaxID=1070528 RepID=A0A6M3IPE0_9ZZZZ
MKTDLFPYQKKGVRKIEHFKGNALLADVMGLGKTLQALTWINNHKELWPAVIVCPATLKYVWEEEAANHLGIRSEIFEGTKPTNIRLPILPPLLIFNYAILSAWVEWIQKLKPKIFVMDECHFIKSRRNIRTTATQKIAQGVPHKIAISGTPLLNRPAELFTTLNMIRPDLFPEFLPFAFRYCKPKRCFGKWVYTGADNLDELHALLNKTMMIRRRETGLPKKSRFVIPLPIDNRAEYNEAKNDFLGWLRKKNVGKAIRASKAEMLTKIGYLKRLAAHLKRESVAAWLDLFLADSNGKIVVFTIHDDMLYFLYERYKSISTYINRNVTKHNRRNARVQFQTDKKTRILFGSIRSAGVGLTLTAAHTAAFAELPWSPGEVTQAEKRIHRIGTTHPVSIFYLVARHTIEEKLCEIIQSKQDILDTVLDGGKVEDLSVWDMLIEEMEKAS